MSFSTLTDINNVKNNTKGASVRCFNLVVDGDQTLEDVNISGMLTMENGSELNFVSGSEIGGFPNFNSTSVTNFENGSIIEGDLQFGNGASVTFDGATSLNFSDTANVNFPSQTITVSPTWTDGIDDFPVVTPTLSLELIRVGNLVTVKIPGFYYTSIGNPGYFQIPWAGIDSIFIPSQRYISSVPVINNGLSVCGYIYCNTQNDEYIIKASGLNINDNFTGANAALQGLGANYTISAGNIATFSYFV